MLSKLPTQLGIIVTILLYSSCSPNSSAIPQNYFLPHEGNALKLKEKNDLSISGGYATYQTTTFENPSLVAFPFPAPGLNSTNPNFDSKTQKMSFQAAYSPRKHLGLFGVHARSRKFSPETDYHNSHLTGGGIGTYYYYRGFQRPPEKVNPNKEPKPTNVLFDIYAGYTFGKIENQYVFTEGNSAMNFQKFYLQGGVHWIGRQVSLSYMMKVGKANFTNGIINGKAHLDSDPAIFALINKKNFTFIEPTFKVDVTFKGIGFFTQLTATTIKDFGMTGIDNPNIQLGLVFDIHELRKINKKSNSKD